MKFKSNAEEIVEHIEIEVTEIETPREEKPSIDLLPLLQQIIETKHKIFEHKDVLKVLTKFCDKVIFLLSIYDPEYKMPQCSSVERISCRCEIIAELRELIKLTNKIITAAAKEGEWLIVKGLMSKLDNIGELIVDYKNCEC